MKRLFLTLSCLFVLQFLVKAQNITLKPGEQFSNFALKTTNGVVYDLKAQRNAKGFILVFMTPSCDHCRAYEKRVMALDQKYKTKGYPVVAIGPYGDYPEQFPLDHMGEMKKLAIAEKFTFPYVSDTQFKYTTLFGVSKTPTAIVLKRNSAGFLIVYKGDIDDQLDAKKVPSRKYVEEQVNKLIK